MHRVGLHIRTDGSLLDLVNRATALELPFFQCFFISNLTNTRIRPTHQEIRQFAQVVQQQFVSVYVHGSYWINLASLQHTGFSLFKKELELARRLACTHMVLHPGTAKGALSKMEGVDALARVLNLVNQTDHGIQLVLENTAHGNLAVGSDITDFGLLLAKLDHPEKVEFCIDTAHAHAFGYDLMSLDGQRDFLALVDATVGTSRVALIHLNDTAHARGSYIDKHAIMGHGVLGIELLKTFVLQPAMKDIPIIMELPAMSLESEREVIQTVRTWF